MPEDRRTKVKEIVDEYFKETKSPREFAPLLEEFIMRKQILESYTDKEFELRVQNLLQNIRNGISYVDFGKKCTDGLFCFNSKTVSISTRFKEQLRKKIASYSLIDTSFHEYNHAFDVLIDENRNMTKFGIFDVYDNNVQANSEGLNELVNVIKTSMMYNSNPQNERNNELSRSIQFDGYPWFKDIASLITTSAGITYDQFVDAASGTGQEFKENLEKLCPTLGVTLHDRPFPIFLNILNDSIKNIQDRDFTETSEENCKNSVTYMSEAIYSSVLSIFKERLKATINIDTDFSKDNIELVYEELLYDFQNIKDIYESMTKENVSRGYANINPEEVSNITTKETDLDTSMQRLNNIISSPEAMDILSKKESQIDKFRKILLYINVSGNSNIDENEISEIGINTHNFDKSDAADYTIDLEVISRIVKSKLEVREKASHNDYDDVHLSKEILKAYRGVSLDKLNIGSKVVSFLKKIFNRNDDLKLLSPGKKSTTKDGSDSKTEFTNSLKTMINDQNIETSKNMTGTQKEKNRDEENRYGR